MTSVHALLSDHISYNIWATTRLLSAAGELTPEQRAHDFGTADKSVFGTLLHLYRAERSWLQRVKHGAPLHEHKLRSDESWNAVQEGWPMVHAEWQTWIADAQEANPDRLIEYQDLKQQQWSQPVWQIVLHVVNHSTHHRGQVMGFLRALGATPPPLDFIFYVRQQSAAH